MLPRIRDELQIRRAHGADERQCGRHRSPSATISDQTGATDPPLGRVPAGRRRRRHAATIGADCIGAICRRDFRIKTVLTERYGARAIPADMTIQDWPVSYDELEPYYDKFDKLCGVSGKAGNLKGQKIEGGNIFEGPRSNEYPCAPHQILGRRADVRRSRRRASATTPSPPRSAAPATPYTNIYGVDARRIANIAASAGAIPARRMPRRRRRPTSCRSCAATRNSSSGRAPSSPRFSTTGAAKRVTGVTLHRHEDRRGIRAARRHRHPVGLRLRQQPYDALFGHRRAL